MPAVSFDYTVNVFELHQTNPDKYPFLLESTAKNHKIGRYDILFLRPQKSIVLEKSEDFNFLDKFNNIWQENQKDEDLEIPEDIPFRGGWFIFLSYELTQQIESCLNLEKPPYPIAYAAKVGAAIIVDKFNNKTFIISDLSEKNIIPSIEKDINLAQKSSKKILSKLLKTSIKQDKKDKFTNSVEKIKEYIVEGDVFQVNISRKYNLEMKKGNYLELYSILREQNPAPFSASCNLPFAWILSSSPERLVKLKNNELETRPIAGTRPRGKTKQQDIELQKTLISDLKEQAEHIMLLDLERNDLGKVCKAGTVKVDETMIIETYKYVHHIVSNVCGQIKDNISPSDVIAAMFPGGTITGAPKIRCMQIISELEETYRGAYTGSIGYINHNGEMDTNILIRSFCCYDDKVSFSAGAGIVYDSIAEHEFKETKNKAKGLLKCFKNTENKLKL